MAAKQKPQEDLVKLAGRAMTHPEELTGSEIKRLAARILDDQKNDPDPHAPSLAAQVIAKVGDLLPDAVKPKAASKNKAAPAPKDEPKPVAAKAKPAASKKAPEVGAAPPDPAPKPAAKTSTAAKGKAKAGSAK